MDGALSTVTGRYLGAFAVAGPASMARFGLSIAVGQACAVFVLIVLGRRPGFVEW